MESREGSRSGQVPAGWREDTEALGMTQVYGFMEVRFLESWIS